MRNALLTLLAVALVAPAAALAVRTAPGDGTLSVEGASGIVAVQARGGVIGRVDRGSLVIADLTPGDGNDAVVQGLYIQRSIGPNTVTYKGRNLRFRLIGGSFRVTLHGTGISLSAVGQGIALLDGDGLDAGVFSMQGDDCRLAPESCEPLPPQPVRLRFGFPERPAASDQGKNTGSEQGPAPRPRPSPPPPQQLRTATS